MRSWSAVTAVLWLFSSTTHKVRPIALTMLNVDNAVVRQYCDCTHWADVFRRIGLDERDHMNTSFIYCGKPECVVEYEGMPEAG